MKQIAIDLKSPAILQLSKSYPKQILLTSGIKSYDSRLVANVLFTVVTDIFKTDGDRVPIVIVALKIPFMRVDESSVT